MTLTKCIRIFKLAKEHGVSVVIGHELDMDDMTNGHSAFFHRYGGGGQYSMNDLCDDMAEYSETGFIIIFQPSYINAFTVIYPDYSLIKTDIYEKAAKMIMEKKDV